MLEDLVWILERAFDRSGVFFIGTLDAGQRHEEIAQLLDQRLGSKGVIVIQCRLDATSTSPLQAFDRLFQQAKAQGNRVVLIIWGLERLPEQQLQRTLRWFNANRERLSQRRIAGQTSVPIVLLVNRVFYRQYLARWAGDLLDCLLPPFELSWHEQASEIL